MFDRLIQDWIVFLIPVISSMVGWGTNVIAVKMMFYPVDFIGIRPWFGWQGIVPAHAKALAAKSTDLITEKLINLRLLFDEFDAQGFAGNLEPALDEITEQIIGETAAKYAPEMWQGLPDPMKDQVRQMVRGEVEKVAVEILADMGDAIEDIIDLKAIVVEVAHRDRRLMGEMFQRVGVEEFRFIKRSGAYFGMIFGIVQLAAWTIYPAWWVLPLFGFFVGYVTNYLAIKLIFEPKGARRIGPFVLQGLFHKRQAAVAQQFATMVSSDVLNADNLVAYMIDGEAGQRLFGIVERRVGELVDRYREHPMTKSMVPADQWDTIRDEVFAQIRRDLPKPGGFLYIFVSRAVDVYGELFGRMTALDPDSFEGVLRPAFQKDEWKLIVAGGVLGMGAGILQVLYLFGDRLA
jgi:uncharacterized membrane protein YheB (UPF0754 family)